MLKFFKNKIDLQIIVLQFLFPIFILIGNAAINVSITLIAFLMLIKIFNNKEILLENRKIIYLLFFFFLSLLINLFFSNLIENSIPRIIKFLPIILFVISFVYVSKKYSEILNLYQKFYFFIILVIIIDLIFELISGTNIIGLSSEMYPSRLGSFTGNEATIGYFFLGLSLFFFSFIFYKYQSVKIIFLSYILIVILSFLIGERASFVRLFLAINILYLFLYKFNLKILLIKIFTIGLIIQATFVGSDVIKSRYFNQIFQYPNGVMGYFENSLHGAHYKVAIEIFKDNPIFGVGIKNFRNESPLKIYDNLNHKYSKSRSSTHPHQLHFELLSETGLFGYLSFMLFIFISIIISFRNFLRFNNYYQLSAILFIVVIIIPIIPTGAFFSTYFSSIFWLNYALMVSYNKRN